MKTIFSFLLFVFLCITISYACAKKIVIKGTVIDQGESFWGSYFVISNENSKIDKIYTTIDNRYKIKLKDKVDISYKEGFYSLGEISRINLRPIHSPLLNWRLLNANSHFVQFR